MNAKTERLGMVSAMAEEAGRIAAIEEVEQALQALTTEDLAKLLIIAKSFCKRRYLCNSVVEPEELLSEAVARTLQLERKWNKCVTLIKHLDRSMESISSHLMRLRNKIESFPEGLEPGDEQCGFIPTMDRADEAPLCKEEIDEMLRQVFGDDTDAARIFTLRSEGFQAAEIQMKFGLGQAKYDAIAKRIRRKIAVHLNQNDSYKNYERKNGHGPHPKAGSPHHAEPAVGSAPSRTQGFGSRGWSGCG